MKERIPWPLKFAVKLLLGLAHVDYRVLKRARIVEHGRMEDVAFCTRVFDRHVCRPLRARHRGAGGRLLEIGPGDSVATGILGLAAGYSRVFLVDVGTFADLRPAAINRLNALLNGGMLPVPEDAGESQVLEHLRAHGIEYLTDGLESLRAIESGSVQHSFSNTVLQHVHREDLPKIIDTLGRLHARGSLCSHVVNFTDHFSGGFVNHRLPDRVMESRIIKRAHLYTNRVAPLPLSERFASAGFILLRAAVDFYDSVPSPHVEYQSPLAFRAAIESRRVLRTAFLFQRA